MRAAVPGYSWSRDPTYGQVLGDRDLAVLWGSLVLGPLYLVVGALLVIPIGEGGYGLSTSELVIASVLGVGCGALLLGAGAWASAIVAVPGSLLLRPSFGSIGGPAVSVLITLLLVGWAGHEFHVGAEALDELLEIAGVGATDFIGWVVAAVVVVLLTLAGPVLATRWWLRWFALGAALALTVAWFVGLGVSGGLAPGSGSARFVPALDLIVTVPVLLFPLVIDTGRFSGAPTEASRVTAIAFGVPALTLLMLGARTVAASGVPADPVDLIVTTVGSGLGTVAALFGALWVVAAFLDQPFGYLQSGGADVASLMSRIPQRAAALGLLVPAVVLAFFVDAGDLVGFYRLAVSILVPVVAVVTADFFVLRGRSYIVDALYERGGLYRLVNVVGIVVVVLGFVGYQWMTPSGPAWFSDWVRDIVPNAVPVGEQYDLPAGIAVYSACFLVYAALGRLAVREPFTVTRISGRI